ncbi:MAG TPA: formyltransferase family protein [Methanomassiliicoccales archaeon]|nr:formyltransferase family protein [Methanomassiliicoccales archaeon]
MKRIGWFTTGRGPGSLGLFSTVRSMIKGKEIDAELSFVFMNREVKGNQCRAKLIAMAEDDGIPVIILPSDGFRNDLKGKDLNAWRDAYGKAMRDKISEHPMDFGVLAGYMLILDPETCSKHAIINLHPALPNTYQGTWEDIVRKVVENGDEHYGSMVHLCTPELDRGQTIVYDRFSLSEIRARHQQGDELVRQIRAVEVRREAPLLMVAIELLVEDRLKIRGGRLFDENDSPVRVEMDASDLVDRRLDPDRPRA